MNCYIVADGVRCVECCGQIVYVEAFENDSDVSEMGFPSLVKLLIELTRVDSFVMELVE